MFAFIRGIEHIKSLLNAYFAAESTLTNPHCHHNISVKSSNPAASSSQAKPSVTNNNLALVVALLLNLLVEYIHSLIHAR